MILSAIKISFIYKDILMKEIEIRQTIEDKEQLGRDTYANYVSTLTSLTFNKLAFATIESRYDFLQTATTTDGKTHYYCGEIKVRNNASTDFPTAYLEVSKYNEVVAAAKEHNCIPVYINFWTDGIVTTYNLNTAVKDLPIVKRKMRCNNYQKRQMYKEVYELPIGKGNRYNV